MKIAVTGATGFIGRYIVDRLIDSGHRCRCWHRPNSNRRALEHSEQSLEWIPGELSNDHSVGRLVEGCDAVVHAALDRPGKSFRGGEGNLVEFVQTNVVGTIRLIESARAAGVSRFLFVSTCAVHERILDDRPLDESHPLWPRTHYGAHKAALEKFVHSYGLGDGYNICALRPSGVYGVHRPKKDSKWYELVQSVVRGETVECTRGGKEVHAADVAVAIDVLLGASGTAGEAYSCCDQYISEFNVAQIAKELSGSTATVLGESKTPKHQIDTKKLQSLGVQFGGDARLRETIAELI